MSSNVHPVASSWSRRRGVLLPFGNSTCNSASHRGISAFFSDFTQQLERAETRKLTARLELFQRKFPQSTLSVFITELPPRAAVADYAFWLANRVRFSDVEAVGTHDFDFVLAIDTHAGAAALTAGYGLDNRVAEEDLAAALEAGRAAFAVNDWASGIEQCVHGFTERLRTIARRARSRTRRL
ncbi:MAG: hypothetical protein ABI233_11060 [Chthoniobacterales bacterium]